MLLSVTAQDETEAAPASLMMMNDLATTGIISTTKATTTPSVQFVNLMEKLQTGLKIKDSFKVPIKF